MFNEKKHIKKKNDESVINENKTEAEIENIYQINSFIDEIINHKHKLENSFDYEYVDVACESNRTLILVKFKNKSYNELFDIGEKNIIYNNKEDKNSDENHIMKLSLNFEKLKIQKLIAKKNTSLFITEDNSIYIRGASFFNFDDEKFHSICKKFEKNIHTIDLGNEHIILLTSIFKFIKINLCRRFT